MPETTLADLALCPIDGRARGPVPTLEEIEQFRRGLLTGARRTEVLSHLAHDPSRFQDLIELERAETQLEAVVRSRISEGGARQPARHRGGTGSRRSRGSSRRMRTRRSLRWGGGMAGALAAALALFAVVPMLPVYQAQLGIQAGYRQLDSTLTIPPSAWPTGIRSGSKAFGLELYGDRADADQRDAFQAGTRAGLTELLASESGWGSVIAALPRSAPGCSLVDRACRVRIGAAEATGRWAMMVFAQCQTGRGDPVFWRKQDRVRQQLGELAETARSPLTVELQRLAGPGTPRSRLCSGIGDLLRTGLDGAW